MYAGGDEVILLRGTSPTHLKYSTSFNMVYGFDTRMRFF